MRGRHINLDTYNNRKRSKLVKTLILLTGTSLEDISFVLGISVPYLNTKCERNSFSMDELITIAHLCGYEFQLKPLATNTGAEDLKFKFEEWFDNDPETLKRFHDLKKNKIKQAREEYLAIQKQLADMKEKYHFKD